MKNPYTAEARRKLFTATKYIEFCKEHKGTIDYQIVLSRISDALEALEYNQTHEDMNKKS